MRDLLLVPISLIAGIIGLIRGGPNADQPFRDILALGRRTEVWINLFGRYRGQTADSLIDPIRDQMVAKVNEELAKRLVSNRSRQQEGVTTHNPADVEDALDHETAATGNRSGTASTLSKSLS